MPLFVGIFNSLFFLEILVIVLFITLFAILLPLLVLTIFMLRWFGDEFVQEDAWKNIGKVMAFYIILEILHLEDACIDDYPVISISTRMLIYLKSTINCKENLGQKTLVCILKATVINPVEFKMRDPTSKAFGSQ
jgi:hypothetical protein